MSEIFMVVKEKEETAARADQSESASDLEKTETPGAFAKMEVAASSVRFPDENPFSSWGLQGAPFQRLRPAWYDLAPLADFPFFLPQRPVEETGGRRRTVTRRRRCAPRLLSLASYLSSLPRCRRRILSFPRKRPLKRQRESGRSIGRRVR